VRPDTDTADVRKRRTNPRPFGRNGADRGRRRSIVKPKIRDGDPELEHLDGHQETVVDDKNGTAFGRRAYWKIAGRPFRRRTGATEVSVS